MGLELGEADLLQRWRQAAAEDLLTLALFHGAELDEVRLRDLQDSPFPDILQLTMGTQDETRGLAVLHGARAWLHLDGEPSQCDQLAVDYAAIYLNHSYRASPCESVWLDEDGLSMQEAMFQVRAEYRRHGLSAADWRQCPDDHLVCQLEFIAALLRRAGQVEQLAEVADFLDRHLLRWIGAFATRVCAHSETAFYAGLALLTSGYLDGLREQIAQVLGQPRRRMSPLDHAPESARQPEATPYLPGVTPSW